MKFQQNTAVFRLLVRSVELTGTSNPPYIAILPSRVGVKYIEMYLSTSTLLIFKYKYKFKSFFIKVLKYKYFSTVNDKVDGKQY